MYWLSSSRKDMQALPDGVKDVCGNALLDAQYGDELPTPGHSGKESAARCGNRWTMTMGTPIGRP